MSGLPIGTHQLDLVLSDSLGEQLPPASTVEFLVVDVGDIIST